MQKTQTIFIIMTEEELAGDLREDLRELGLTWEDALDAAEDRDGWRKCIARCAALHGRAKVRNSYRNFTSLYPLS